MLSGRYTFLVLALLFVVAAGLMIGAMREESATMDEPVFLGAGYSYWLGGRYRLNPEHPPLAQLLAGLPLTMLNVKLPPQGAEILRGQAMLDTTVRWDVWAHAKPEIRSVDLFPHGPNFYYYPWEDGRYFGEQLIYGGQNDGEKLIFWGRIPEVLLTLVLGLVVFCWTRYLRGNAAALLAASMLLLNPVVLAYGHIVHTDIGITLGLSLAIWMFARLLEAPDARRAVYAGLATGVALAMKYTAVILAPVFLLLLPLYRWRHRDAPRLGWGRLIMVAGVAWGVVLLLYTPHWAPPPLIDGAAAGKLGVPHWFVWLRPILIPAEYFKGLALVLLHASSGHNAYLNGAWSHSGWWYYFPVAFFMKAPLPFLVFVGAGLLGAVRGWRELRFGELAAWVGAGVYLLIAMAGKADIGVRHILPVYPLIAVGAACALSRLIEQMRPARHRLTNGLVTALPLAALVTATMAYPFFISYLNPLVGGPEHGQEHLLDSNFDWGQNTIRLKNYLVAHGIQQFSMQYFGPLTAMEYYGFTPQNVTAEDAKQIRQGYLVVSAQCLMRPDWQWLRDSRQPVKRIGYSVFVYQMGNP
jgi:Dolichyl-phosphate-mannose-protein mannosyltransferase